MSGDPVMTAVDRFRLLNVEDRCISAEDWQRAGSGRLWLYNLHYFDDLNAHGADDRASWHGSLIDRWIAENPPGRGVGWEPYPLSRRIINWIKWSARGHELSARARDSLAVQLRWLESHLEYHLLGNHLFANAKALVFGGLRFQGSEAQRWLERGLSLVHEQLKEQILEDGGHFELSPMYHAAMLEDLLDLLNASRAAGISGLNADQGLANRMLGWLEAMSHPDGEISFFNDSAFGVAPTAMALREYASRLDLAPGDPPAAPLTHLASSGYVSARLGAAYLVCDCARVGPDYLPGHAHADTLSFEFSLNGQRLLVNSGTSEYEYGKERDRQRGTLAHNTVAVNGQDSSEVWGSFRVARRATVRLHEARSDGAVVCIQASHDGYRRRGAGEVRRQWMLKDGILIIQDDLEKSCSAIARLHLHPRATARLVDESKVLLEAGGSSMSLSFAGAQKVLLEESSWHPRFGERVPNVCVSAEFCGNQLRTELHWCA